MLYMLSGCNTVMDLAIYAEFHIEGDRQAVVIISSSTQHDFS